MHKFKKIFTTTLAALILTCGATILKAYSQEEDVDMSKSYSILYANGRRAEYHKGTIIPGDDASVQSSKSVAAYSNYRVYVSAKHKSSGGSSWSSKRIKWSDPNSEDTWIHSGWTNDPYDHDFAEQAIYDFNGYTIHIK